MNYTILLIIVSFTISKPTNNIVHYRNNDDLILLDKFIEDSLVYVNEYRNTNLNSWYDKLVNINEKMQIYPFVESFISDYAKIKQYVRDKEDISIFDIKYENFNFISYVATYHYLYLESVSLYEISVFISKYDPIIFCNISSDILQIECYESMNRILSILKNYSHMCYNLRSLYFYIIQQNKITIE